jgi:hypothetical protein
MSDKLQLVAVDAQSRRGVDQIKWQLFRYLRTSQCLRFLWYKDVEDTLMAIAQYYFDFAPRPVLRLCFIEEVIKKQSLITPPPSRPTLIALIERGDMEGKKTDFGYVVLEDSFRNWIKRMTTDLVAA